MMLDWFQKIFGKDSMEVEQQPNKEYKNLMNPQNVTHSNIVYKDNHIGDVYHINVYNTPEHSSTMNDGEIASKVKPIESLLEKHHYSMAIEKYKDLLEEYASKSLSNNDLFYIQNGILNCYINLDDKENTEKYIEKIKLLGRVDEIHKFHYLCAVFYINQRNLQKAYEEINKAIGYKPDYFKAICLKPIIERDSNIVDVGTAIRQLINDDGCPIIGNGDNKDNAHIFNTLGDIYFVSRDYQEAIKYYSKANELLPSPYELMHIGISLFYDASKNAKIGEVIDPKDVDYKKLREANSILGELYLYKDEEVRKVIRKHISSFYIKSLYLLRETAKINTIFPEIKEYCIDEKEELYRFKAISEMLDGGVTTGTLEGLSQQDKAWILLLKMMEDKKFDKVVNVVESLIWTEYKGEEKYHYILLEAYLKLNTDDSFEKFERHIKQLKDLGMESGYTKFLKGLYYESKGDMQRAESIVKEVARDTFDFHLYYELICFYERNKFEYELGELFDDLLREKQNTIEAVKNIFYRKYFLYLFRNNLVEKAVEVHSNLEIGYLDSITYSYITGELMSLVGDFKKSAKEFEQCYELTNNLEYLFKSLIQYIYCNNIDKADELIRLLIRNDYHKNAIIYAIYSNLEILKNNTEKAYEYAKTALEIDKDNAKSDMHQFYVVRSIRCNKEEGKAYIPVYVSNFPNHNKWVKSVKLTETDEFGNEVYSKEIKEFFTASNQYANAVLANYSNRQFGISILAKEYRCSILQTLEMRNVENIKIHIHQGVVQEVNSETTLLNSKVVIDAFSLYIMAEIDCLHFLEKLDTIYITYSTIETLQNFLLSKEDENTRVILKFINQALNIEIVYPDYKIQSQLKDKFQELLFDDQLDSSVYSYSNNIPYLYSDYFVKGLMDGYNDNFIGIVAFFRALLRESIISKEDLSIILLNLKKNKYDFINFDSMDVFNIAQKSNFIVDENIKLFFCIDRYSDIASFANVYIGFFSMIYNNIDRGKFDAYADLFISVFDSYIKKTQYYFNILEDKYSQFEKQLRRLREKNALSSVLVFKQLGIEMFAEEFEIANSFEFGRIYTILSGCEGALRLFLYMFKNEEKEFEYYSQKVRSQCKNLLESEIELLIKQTKEIDFTKINDKNK